MITDWKVFLAEHDVDPNNGFLVTPFPDTSLSSYFATWDQAGRYLPEWIEKNVVASEVSKLPFKDPGRITTKGEMERAMLILSFLGNAYVHSSTIPHPVIPRNLAVPWRYIATRLGRPPVLAHASAVLANWQLKDRVGSLTLDNLEPMVTFTETSDEKWFYMITVEIESQAAEAVAAAALAIEYCNTSNPENLLQQLKVIRNSLRLMTNTLKRMKEGCDPAVFYHRIRPFLGSFHQVQYDMGGKIITESWHGGSAAQSTVLQFLDAALGVRHTEEKSATYMAEMLQYMPPKHAQLIRDMKGASLIVDFCTRDKTLIFFLEKAIETMHEFRTEHFKIAHEYIVAQAKAEEGYVGTGGTDVSFFLKTIRDDTKKKGD